MFQSSYLHSRIDSTQFVTTADTTNAAAADDHIVPDGAKDVHQISYL